MTTKGFADNNTNIETPNGIGVAEKPLKSQPISSNRVDINVLKSKLQETESKEFENALSAFKDKSLINYGTFTDLP